jgi:tetratricopeptide (TPR) repeat protein
MRQVGRTSKFRCLLTLTGLIFGSAAATLAQKGGGASTSPSGPAAGGAGTTTTSPGNPGITRAPGSTPEPTPQTGVYLTGSVRMDDGTAPPESVTVYRVCNGNPHPVAYTDSKGGFGFQLNGDNDTVMADASIASSAHPGLGNPAQGAGASGSGARRLLGCDLQVVMPGYRSDALGLENWQFGDSPEIGTIVLHRLGNVEGASISATSLEAPRDSKKAYEKGLEAEKRQKWPEAQAEFEKAVAGDQKYAAAWFELGSAYQHQGDKVMARGAYQKSLEADRKFLKPYLPLCAMAFEEKDWEETISLADTLTRLDPGDFPLAYLLNAIANFSLGRLDLAEKSAREAIKIDTLHRVPRAEYVLGRILLEKRDYDGALALLKSYIQRAPDARDGEAIKKQIGEIENLAKAQPQPAPPQH